MKRMDLRTARKRRKLSQRQLSIASGIEQPIISRYENGHVANPDFNIVIKLAKALDMDPRLIKFDSPQELSV